MDEQPTTFSLSPALSDLGAWRAEGCSMAATLEVIGPRAAFLCLREALYGVRRFDEFVRRVGASDAVVAARLKDLVAAGLLERRPYREPGQRARQEYVLTERGADLAPVVVALTRWGDRWVAPRGEAPVALSHAGECRAPVSTELRCERGHRLRAQDVHVRGARRQT